MWLVQLYPFVYISFLEKSILLYSTLNGAYYVIDNIYDIRIINNSAFVLLGQNSNRNRICEIISDNLLGTIQETDSISPNILISYTSKLYEYYNSFIEDFWESKFVKERYIHTIEVSLADCFNIFDRTIRNSQHKLMSSDIFNSLLINMSEFKNLVRININATYKSIEKSSSILKKIIHNYKVEIYTLLEDFIKHQKKFLSLGCNLNLIIYQVNDYNISFIQKYIDIYDNVFFSVFITSEEDYYMLDSYNLLSRTNIAININPNARDEDLNNLLSYGLEDIYCHNLSVENIIEREYLNPLYWGTLFIDFDGTVFMNMNKTIGNINTWGEIKFDKLLCIESFWRLIRKNFSPCKGCSLMNVCPPVSLIEKVTNRHYCMR